MYEVTITKRDKVKRMQQVWQRMTDNPNVEKQYGYAEPIETYEINTTEILKQQIEDLDIAAVIKAVNKL